MFWAEVGVSKHVRQCVSPRQTLCAPGCGIARYVPSVLSSQSLFLHRTGEIQQLPHEEMTLNEQVAGSGDTGDAGMTEPFISLVESISPRCPPRHVYRHTLTFLLMTSLTFQPDTSACSFYPRNDTKHM